MPEVASKVYAMYPVVSCGFIADNLPAGVMAAIINEDDFPIKITELLFRFSYKQRDVFFLVVAGDYQYNFVNLAGLGHGGGRV